MKEYTIKASFEFSVMAESEKEAQDKGDKAMYAFLDCKCLGNVGETDDLLVYVLDDKGKIILEENLLKESGSAK